MTPQEEYENSIEDYTETIHAIVGFMNFFRYDDVTKKMKTGIKVFQGKRLNSSPHKTVNPGYAKSNYVTPDAGILLPSKNGVLGEVKKSFPVEQTFWMRTFQQLLAYDDDLIGWPSNDEKVNTHDIVLLVHQTRAVLVRKFYEDREGKEIKFDRPFIIMLFNRADERKPNYYFQTVKGHLSEKSLDARLEIGVSVPMKVFVKVYSTIKIYDSCPPLPYLMDLIWTNVVLPKASDDPKFAGLHKNQKIDIILEIDDIAEKLYEGFSFRILCGDNSERQQHIPKREWIVTACEQLIKTGEAIWVDTGKKEIEVSFRRYDDTQEHFIETCSGEQDAGQRSLFENEAREDNS